MRDPIAAVKELVQRRRGAPKPRVPDGTRLYAVGDIHGRADLLDDLHGRIKADAGHAPAGAALTIVYLGDYVDRGADSKGVIQRLLATSLPGFRKVHLKGNHEDLFLGFLNDPDEGWSWMINGGDATVRSYGVTLTGDDESSGRMMRIRDELAARVPRAHLEFLHSLQMCHVSGDYMLVHAGIRPGVALDRQSEIDFMWIRGEFLRSRADHGKVVVHGHTPAAAPQTRANRIGIDTAAFASDVLTCLVLEGTEQRFLATGGQSLIEPD